jgi:hypothetical protein
MVKACHKNEIWICLKLGFKDILYGDDLRLKVQANAWGECRAKVKANKLRLIIKANF